MPENFAPGSPPFRRLSTPALAASATGTASWQGGRKQADVRWAALSAGPGLVRSFTDAKSRTCRSASWRSFQAQNVTLVGSHLSRLDSARLVRVVERGAAKHQCNQ